MGSVRVKAFILQNSNCTGIASCEDSLAVSVPKGRFAVADGVTNSYHPEFMAQLLCRRFVDGALNINDWDHSMQNVISNDIHNQWSSQVEEYESGLSGRRLNHAIEKRKNLPVGLSTFAGIEVDLNNKRICGKILGDSTLFYVTKQGWRAFCSNIIDCTDNVPVQYDNHPSCVSADGVVIGHWIDVDLPLQDGYLFLMTDGCAEWFQSELRNSTEIADRVWSIPDHEAFAELAASARKNLQMDDDLSMIILKIDLQSASGFVIDYFDSFSQVTFLSLQDQVNPNEEPLDECTCLADSSPEEALQDENDHISESDIADEEYFEATVACEVSMDDTQREADLGLKHGIRNLFHNIYLRFIKSK